MRIDLQAPVRLRIRVPCALQAALAGLLGAPAAAIAQPTVEIQINQTADTRDDYIGWSPVLARIRVSQSDGMAGTVPIVLRNHDPAQGGQVRFAAFQDPWPAGTTATQEQLALSLSADGSWVPFVIAGQFGRPSRRDRDAVVQARAAAPGGAALGQIALMVRVRKNADSLTADERTRFLDALVRLNTKGGYDVFQQMHSLVGGEAHSGRSHTAYSFLPWHRAMLLAFERALQEIDPSIALPYWRFDRPAPNVFSPDFMGGPSLDGSNRVHLSLTNPLFNWNIANRSGIERKPTFMPDGNPDVQADAVTLNQASFLGFRAMERGPHADAHNDAGGTGGWLRRTATAVQDPLFFLLHANIDRLWAQWQVTMKRFDPGSHESYSPQGAHPGAGCALVGQHSLDTMWPWNGATFPGDQCRPSRAPGGPFPALAPGVFVPPQQPRPYDLIDYRTNAASLGGAGFSYDSVPFN